MTMPHEFACSEWDRFTLGPPVLAGFRLCHAGA